MNPKPWYLSKTFWIGFIQMMIAVSTFIAEFITDNTFDSTAQWLLFANGILMIFMRWLTTEPISTPVIDRLRNK